jgi:hypothetical protein
LGFCVNLFQDKTGYHHAKGFARERGAIEAQIFNFAQKLNRRTAAELCNFAPLLQNPC